MRWHQLDHMQTICTSLQTDNHTNINTSSLNFYRPMLFLMPNQQSQSYFIIIAQPKSLTFSDLSAFLRTVAVTVLWV